LGVCVNGLLLVGLPTILFAQNYALLDKSTHNYAGRYARTMLGSLPPDCVFMTNGDNGFSLVRYFQLCESYRTDIIHIHRPSVTWDSHKTQLRELYPQWFSKSSSLEQQVELNRSAQHHEAKTEQDYFQYMKTIARVTESASAHRDVFWEGGSDTHQFWRYLEPWGIVYRFSLDGTTKMSHFNFDKSDLNVIVNRDFLLDHNAVSEYAVMMYNLGNFMSIKADHKTAGWSLALADQLWRSQLDPLPHNVLVENMEDMILIRR